MTARRKAEPTPNSAEDFISARKRSRLLLVPNHPDRPQIDSHIPVPAQTRGGTRKFDHYYPFEEMSIGDSFWVPSDTQCTAGAVTKFSKKTGWKFVTRGQSQDGRKNMLVNVKAERGTRVWRVG